ncbi:MAG TPA: hypothetical protein VL443_08345 [Cyclobacteriaceae bacterium]|nr:hypothetical protein [Cyclobacteriaceae bacterium]
MDAVVRNPGDPVNPANMPQNHGITASGYNYIPVPGYQTLANPGYVGGYSYYGNFMPVHTNQFRQIDLNTTTDQTITYKP